jgi:hypothetical protein
MIRDNQRKKGLTLGFYLPDIIPGPASYSEFENLIDQKIDLLSFYWSWGLGKSVTPFTWIRAILAENKIPLVTWEPWVIPPDDESPASSIVDTNFSLSRIIQGCFDDYILFWARRLKPIEGQIFLRPMHEMNGNWYPWCGMTNGNEPRQFILAWKHLRHLFDDEGLTHVKWVWSPYVFSVPDTVENEIQHYYPGDSCVDWIGLDGYNWGVSREWSHWQTFEEVFEAAYRMVTQLTEKPVMIAETGCAESGGSKAIWISDALASIRENHRRILAVTWFNANKECDWRIESSQASLSSFKKNWPKTERRV